MDVMPIASISLENDVKRMIIFTYSLLSITKDFEYVAKHYGLGPL